MMRKFALRLLTALLLLTAYVGIPTGSASALDVSYRCKAEAGNVFVVAKETVWEMSAWRSIRIVDHERTIKAVVRNWRNFAVPVWIQVRASLSGASDEGTEVHLLWEQGMEPLNYPDVIPFLEAFGERQKTLGLECIGTGTDIGP